MPKRKSKELTKSQKNKLIDIIRSENDRLFEHELKKQGSIRLLRKFNDDRDPIGYEGITDIAYMIGKLRKHGKTVDDALLMELALRVDSGELTLDMDSELDERLEAIERREAEVEARELEVEELELEQSEVEVNPEPEPEPEMEEVNPEPEPEPEMEEVNPEPVPEEKPYDPAVLYFD